MLQICFLHIFDASVTKQRNNSLQIHVFTATLHNYKGIQNHHKISIDTVFAKQNHKTCSQNNHEQKLSLAKIQFWDWRIYFFRFQANSDCFQHPHFYHIHDICVQSFNTDIICKSAFEK